MELSIKTSKLDNAVLILDENMKKKSRVLPSDMRKSLINLLKKNSDLVAVKGNKIILHVVFYPIWIKEHNLNKDTKEVDNIHYNFFKKLRKYGYIHSKSSYFPKKLAVITLNPTLSSLYKGKMEHISNYANGKKSLYQLDDSVNHNIDAYIDLRLYQAFMLTEKELKSIKTSNIIFAGEDSACIYIEDKGVFDNIEIPPYHLIPISGSRLIKILKQYKRNEVIHPFDNDGMEDHLLKHKQKFFPNMSIQDIKYASKNNMLIKSSPAATTLSHSRKIMSQVTIAELDSLYPASVPKHLIELEKKRIANALYRTNEINEEDNVTDSSFSLEEFDYFDELLKTKNTSSFMKKIAPAKRELNQYANSPRSEAHGILITKYIVHLLSRVEKENKERHLVIRTFRNYYSLVKKHLFENIEDLSNVQSHEINEILLNLAVNKYKDKSILNVRGRINDFFSFHGKKQNAIPMKLASYPKSLVFEFEIDPILKAIEDNYKDEQSGPVTRYKILRDKAIVLMGRYTGLRKNELRSRLIRDVYLYGNELCIDVNKEGLKKLDLKLKTYSAKRRVCTNVTNKEHLKIINDYIEAREKIRNKNPFFFLHVDEKNKIKSKVVKEDIFDKITLIIQKTTKRYTSFHSLRHTFATYAVKEILECKKINPYKLINLAVMMGHTSPEITLKKYTHRSVIDLNKISQDWEKTYEQTS